MARGHHKIFIGMAAGVGKTYRMLQEGRAALAEGHDVVIGYLEAHRRAETMAQAEGIEVVPRCHVNHRGALLQEMDLQAVIRRMPEIALVDELAHSNAPGLKNRKRYQDVEELLELGIDVYSTVNVQHLESLNDEVAEFSGVRVRETLPDSVLKQADEVVLMDLTPEALIARLEAGKIYDLKQVPDALNNFFKIENLAALRQVALRQVAEDVETKRLTHELGVRNPGRVSETTAPQAIAERLLALVKPEPAAQRVVRRAWRAAKRLGAQLDILVVIDPTHQLSVEQSRQLDALVRIASVLGAQFLEVHSDDVVAATKEVTTANGTTYLLLGASSYGSLSKRLKQPLPIRLAEALPGIDIRIVADRSRLNGGGQ